MSHAVEQAMPVPPVVLVPMAVFVIIAVDLALVGRGPIVIVPGSIDTGMGAPGVVVPVSMVVIMLTAVLVGTH